MYKVFFLLALLSVLSGCSSNKPALISSNTPTMKDIYQEKFHAEQGLTREDVSREIHDGDHDLNMDVKRSVQRLRRTFRYLPNPLMTMYIYPHLTDAGTPVPGYTTFFKFYEIDHVGLSQEFPVDTHNSEQE